MDAHRVDVLDRADDDAVIRLVADDLHLIFLPAEDRLLDQDFRRRRRIETAADDLEEFRTVVGDAAAGAAEREGRADDRGQADVVERLRGNRHGVVEIALLAIAFTEVPLIFQLVESLVEFGAGEPGFQLRPFRLVRLAIQILDVGGVRKPRSGRFKTDLRHGLAEEGTILGLVDRLRLGADHLDIVAVEHAHAAQRERRVERRLPTHGRQQRVGTLLGDDLGDDFRCNRFDVGRIGQSRVGHDRCRVGIDQDDPVAFFLQRLAGLRAGIVEFTCLTDDDRPRADDEDRFDILALRHGSYPFLAARKTGQGGRSPAGARIYGLFRLEAAYRQMFLQAKPRKFRNRQ